MPPGNNPIAVNKYYYYYKALSTYKHGLLKDTLQLECPLTSQEELCSTNLAVYVFIMGGCWTRPHIFSTGHKPQIFFTIHV